MKYLIALLLSASVLTAGESAIVRNFDAKEVNIDTFGVMNHQNLILAGGRRGLHPHRRNVRFGMAEGTQTQNPRLTSRRNNNRHRNVRVGRTRAVALMSNEKGQR